MEESQKIVQGQVEGLKSALKHLEKYTQTLLKEKSDSYRLNIQNFF
jgi:hypothetical protein